MRTTFLLVVVIGSLSMPQVLAADDGDTAPRDSSWGNSGALRGPVKDAAGSGHWWWPTEPSSNVGDKELWGNGGAVYGKWSRRVVAEEPRQAKLPVEPPPERAGGHEPFLKIILFDEGKAVLRPEGKAVADDVVGWAKACAEQFPNDIFTVTGHTCDLGDEASNIRLGRRRADAVKDYLVQAGVAASRIKTESFGQFQPDVPNDSPEHRKLNRRAVITVTLSE